MINREKVDVAIVGATGAVGQMFLEILQERHFPVGNLYPLASERSEGEIIQFDGRNYRVKNVADFDFSKAQIAFFSAGSAASVEYVPKAADAGCIVIDNSSQFRYEPDIPLVVPEVNAHALVHYRNRNIIANPNCSTIQMVVALKPIYDRVGVRRINIATYQSVSGAGRKAIEELAGQTVSLLNGQSTVVNKIFPQQIAFNVLPHIDAFLDNGYTKEEMKIVWEAKKIFEDEHIEINPTAVRVPVFFAHSEAVAIETEQPITAAEVVELLAGAPGISVFRGNEYPTALTAANQDSVFVGRIRNDLNKPNGINLWIVSDNVRKGAALNGVQIAELLLEQNFALH